MALMGSPSPNKLEYISGDVEVASGIMREAAEWLVGRGELLWSPHLLDTPALLERYRPEDIYVGRWLGLPAIAFVLQWDDNLYWPEVSGDSGFIHKLCVLRRFAGTGFGTDVVRWAADECRARSRKYLRLDAPADRPHLLQFYERLGFVRVDTCNVEQFEVVRYEMLIQ